MYTVLATEALDARSRHAGLPALGLVSEGPQPRDAAYLTPALSLDLPMVAYLVLRPFGYGGVGGGGGGNSLAWPRLALG